MKKIYVTPDINELTLKSSDIITSSTGMTLGTYTTGMVLGEEDFGEYTQNGF